MACNSSRVYKRQKITSTSFREMVINEEKISFSLFISSDTNLIGLLRLLKQSIASNFPYPSQERPRERGTSHDTALIKYTVIPRWIYIIPFQELRALWSNGSRLLPMSRVPSGGAILP